MHTFLWSQQHKENYWEFSHTRDIFLFFFHSTHWYTRSLCMLSLISWSHFIFMNLILLCFFGSQRKYIKERNEQQQKKIISAFNYLEEISLLALHLIFWCCCLCRVTSFGNNSRVFSCESVWYLSWQTSYANDQRDDEKFSFYKNFLCSQICIWLMSKWRSCLLTLENWSFGMIKLWCYCCHSYGQERLNHLSDEDFLCFRDEVDWDRITYRASVNWSFSH